MHLIFLFLYPFVDEENQNFGLDNEDHDAYLSLKAKSFTHNKVFFFKV